MEIWKKVVAGLQENNQAHRQGKSKSTPGLLTGILFDTNGVRFTPTHAVRNSKRYRYYSSEAVIRHAGIKPAITRFPAETLEQIVRSQIHLLLQAPQKCINGMKADPRKDTVEERTNEGTRAPSKHSPSRLRPSHGPTIGTNDLSEVNSIP
jgi:hypothetical protein